MNETPDPLHAVIPVLEERERLAAGRVEELKREIEAATEELADARGALDRIQRLAGVGRPAPEGKRPMWLRVDPDGHGPEGLEAVAAALMQSPKPLPLPELTAAVEQLGWRPQTNQPERAVRAAANRLRRKDPDFDYVEKRFAYLPNHRDQLPPRLGGEGDFTEDND